MTKAQGVETTATGQAAPADLPMPASRAQHQGGETVYPAQPFDRTINPRNRGWAGYRPRWLLEAEKTVRIDPVNFQHLRKHVHCMSLPQCAAFLRVDAGTVAKWESGLETIPYAAYLALRLVNDLQFLPHQVKEWADWRIVATGADVGMLLDTRTGEMFSAGEITTMRYAYAQASGILTENARLKQAIAGLQGEVQRLRGLRQLDGIAGELQAVQERMRALLDGLNQGAIPNINQGAYARTFEEQTA